MQVGKIEQLTTNNPMHWNVPVDTVKMLKMEKAIAALKLYFTSGNSVQVDQATIRAEDFWRILDGL